MKNIVTRSIIFGVLASILFLAISLASLFIGASLHQTTMQWPFFVFLAGGAPLSWIIQHILDADLAWLPNPGDGPVGSAMSELFFAACFTWPTAIAAARYWVLRRRGPAPNNSFKPKPLRSGKGMAG